MITAQNKTGRHIAPGPRGSILFGNLYDVRRDPLRFYLEAQRHYGDVVRLRSFYPFTWHLISHPDDIEHVLRGNYQNYPKGMLIKQVAALAGQGLVTSEGELWLRQRRLAQPAFHRQRLAALAGTMAGAAEALVERWHAPAMREQPIDVAVEMMRLTLQVVGQALFSTDISGAADAVGRAMPVALEHIDYRMTHIKLLPDRFPTPRNRRFWQAKRTLDQVVYNTIEERRRAGTDQGDLLSMLLLARDEETGTGMSDTLLRDEVMTILVAGHETTAVALSWTWYLLAQHPEVERRLHAELDAVLGGRTPTFEDLPSLPYTKMVIEETMRLYPPAWGMVRQAREADEIGGYHIPANSIIAIVQYVTHRHQDFWDRPEEFDPERFTPERSASRPRFAYFPFGGGPRQCIGNNFAMMEAQLILATVAQRYRLRLVPGHPVEPRPMLTLRPRYGIRMTVQGRGGSA